MNTHGCSGLLDGLFSKTGYMIDDRGEVGGAVEFDLRETRPVGLHHPFYTCTTTADHTSVSTTKTDTSSSSCGSEIS